MPRRKRKAKARPKCRDTRWWGYPATDRNDGPIEFAWSCRCGAHGASYLSEDEARAAVEAHLAPEPSFDEALDAI